MSAVDIRTMMLHPRVERAVSVYQEIGFAELHGTLGTKLRWKFSVASKSGTARGREVDCVVAIVMRS